MTTVSKFTTPTAAGAEVHSRAERYATTHNCTYREGMIATLANDRQLAQAYAEPAIRRRVSTLATTDPRSKPVVSITPADEAEIVDWIKRAITDGKAGSLPGALGSLAIEADAFKELGMPVEEAVRRAMGLFPHLVDMSKLLLVDVRRNAPEKPVAQQAQANPAGFEVHARAEKLQQQHPNLDYRSAVHQVLDGDTQLKARYAGVQR